MLHLVQQPGRNRAIKHQVALEKLHLLDRLPPLYRRRTRCGVRFVVERVLGLQMMVVPGGVFVVVQRRMRIGAVRVRARDHGPPVVILPVVIWLRAVWVWALVVRRGIVRRVVVRIVMRLGVERVAAVLAMGGVRGVLVVVVGWTVGNVFDRILHVVSELPLMFPPHFQRTLGCSASLSEGVPGPGPGPIGISNGPACECE